MSRSIRSSLLMGRWLSHLGVAALLGVLVWAAWYGNERQAEFSAWLAPKRPVTLYFATAQADALVPVVEYLPVDKADPRGALERLLEGPPPNSGLWPVVPAGTKLLSLRVDPATGDAVADFSRELISEHPGGSASEILTVYGIVNTLTEFADVRQVLLRVEGNPVSTLVGHLDLRSPLSRDESLVVGQSSTPGPGNAGSEAPE